MLTTSFAAKSQLSVSNGRYDNEIECHVGFMPGSYWVQSDWGWGLSWDKNMKDRYDKQMLDTKTTLKFSDIIYSESINWSSMDRSLKKRKTLIYQWINILTHRLLETDIYKFNTVATDTLELRHQPISIPSAEYIFIFAQKYYIYCEHL